MARLRPARPGPRCATLRHVPDGGRRPRPRMIGVPHPDAWRFGQARR